MASEHTGHLGPGHICLWKENSFSSSSFGLCFSDSFNFSSSSQIMGKSRLGSTLSIVSYTENNLVHLVGLCSCGRFKGLILKLF